MSFSRDPTQPWRWNAVSSPETAIQRVPVTAPMASRDGTAPPLASRASPGRASPGRASPGRAALGRRDWQAPWERDAGPRPKGPPSPAGSLSSRLEPRASPGAERATGRVDRALEVRQARREAAEAARHSRVSSARAEALSRRAEQEEVAAAREEASLWRCGAYTSGVCGVREVAVTGASGAAHDAAAATAMRLTLRAAEERAGKAEGEAHAMWESLRAVEAEAAAEARVAAAAAAAAAQVEREVRAEGDR